MGARDKAVEAATFYASLFPDSRVDSVTPLPADSPSGPASSVQVVAVLENAYRG